MKKYLILIVCALLMSSCIDRDNPIIKFLKSEFGQSGEGENKRAAESVWDFYLIGEWKYTQENENGETTGEYAKGIETFAGDGTYTNTTIDAYDDKVVLKGTWALDADEDYTINIKIDKRITSDGDEDDVDLKMVYTLVSLEPEVSFNYITDGKNRSAEWVAGEGGSNAVEDDSYMYE